MSTFGPRPSQQGDSRPRDTASLTSMVLVAAAEAVLPSEGAAATVAGVMATGAGLAAGMVVAAATEGADWGARVLMKEVFAAVAACSGLAVMVSVGCSAGAAMEEAAAEEAPTPNMPVVPLVR